MNVFYVYGGCSPHKYYEYVESKGFRIGQQAQKYNQLLMEGLVENGVEVYAISSRPINSTLSNHLFYPKEYDTENGINYYYVPFINKSKLRNISVLFGVAKHLLSQQVKTDSVLICDTLNIAATAASLLVCKFRKITSVGIVTDVPCHRPSNAKIPFYERVNLALMKKFDRYLLLTEQMNGLVNPENKPHIVLEGHSDETMSDRKNSLNDKYNKFTILYAGTLRKVYGIEYLVEGFLKANIPDSELHIYGSGDFQEDLKALVQEHDNVKYFGVAPNNVVVEAEIKADLLVNPRPTDEEYAKYSFPSKNMEYMASGTPVLTTKLPGMPEDHKSFLFFIDDESVEGVCSALKKIYTNYSRAGLLEFGAKAKTFIVEEKNNIRQAKKLIDFIENNSVV